MTTTSPKMFKILPIVKSQTKVIAQLVKHWVGDRKAADSRFDSQTGSALLCPWERHFTLISHWDQAGNWSWCPTSRKIGKQNQKRCIGVAVRYTQSACYVHSDASCAWFMMMTVWYQMMIIRMDMGISLKRMRM